MNPQTVVGFQISALSFDNQISTIMRWVQGRLSKVVCVSNVHMLMEGHWRPEFAQVLLGADLLTPDGMPLVWLTSLMKGKPQDRVAGMELMMGLCEQAQALGASLFLLGSTPDALERICQHLAKDFPQLKVAGMISPPFRKLSKEEDEMIATRINESGAGLVFVSLGCPKQERWMSANRGQVKAVMVGLGGAFSVYVGDKQWAPAWVRNYGLEWCYRLAQEPRRLWKRYASTVPPFLWIALKQIVLIRLGIDPDTVSTESSINKIVRFFPEEWQAEFGVLQERLRKKKFSKGKMRYELLLTLFQLFWACAQIKADNLWLRSQERDQ
jgi:N-acetylglucosaminyldiphosphoundecaprenol N-acetyl-beta-D-mannosaminyltransferase